MFGFPSSVAGSAGGVGLSPTSSQWAFSGAMAGVPSTALLAGQAASFHAPGAKNEIKLFVGGLQFQTQGKVILFSNYNLENDLYTYFS